MSRRPPLPTLAALLVSATTALADGRVPFAPLAGDIQNPERGFWRFADWTFRIDNPEALQDIRAAGMTLTYGVVRLDTYRDRPLDAGLLADLERSFANARAAGVKVILRFTYNYPESSQQFEAGEDAPLPVVLGHIAQLAPLLAANADTLAAVQAGFIGAWGEGHTSSNGLDSPKGKAAMRDALEAAVPQGVPLQWRYPADLRGWEAEGELGRWGMHNDCFLSSPTDVGTYEGDAAERAGLRNFAADLSGQTFFSGETCDAQPDQVRTDCASILREGAAFHVSSLGRDYWLTFHEAWAREGCWAEVTARMGYRLRLVEARVEGQRIEVDVANDGWARLARPRTLWLRTRDAWVLMSPMDLSAVGPGEVVTFGAVPASLLGDRICLAAPDPSPRLEDDPRFAIRFANADAPGQAWENGAFCLDAP